MIPSAIQHPSIDPVFIRLGPLELRWYGMMYLLGFVAAYFVIRHELKRKGGPIDPTEADDLLFYMIVGLLLGARIGYVLIYNLDVYLAAPWQVFAFWQGGMSFHGGLVGIVLSGLIFCRRRNAAFWELADIGALSAPIGLMLGRIGNFINGELYGRVTDVPWGVIFPEGGPLPRHPSQLYEAFLEGPVLFGIMWMLRTRIAMPGQLLAVFLIGYGVFRFIVEFLREPDPQLGFVFAFFTMGQILCVAMIVAGLGLFVYLHLKRNTKEA